MSSEAFKQEPTLTSMFQAIDRIDTQFPHGYNDLKAVEIGGGTGAPVSIRPCFRWYQTSAVVAMADDGGSTGICVLKQRSPHQAISANALPRSQRIPMIPSRKRSNIASNSRAIIRSATSCSPHSRKQLVLSLRR